MTGDLTRDDLLAIIRRQDEQYKRLEAENKALRADITRLKKRIEELEHKGRKYTAPHSREVRKADPKPPGRRAGQGVFSAKAPPTPEEVTQVVKVDEPNTCAKCGFVGTLIPKRTDKAWITELPAGLRAEITEYHVPVMTCPQCGRQVRGEHPALSCRQWGATAHRLGGRLKAVVQTLRHEVGIAERRLPRVLALTTGIQLTQSAINQAAGRLTRDGRPLPVAVQELEAELRAAPYVHHDDTGWRIDATQGWISTCI